LTLNEGRLRVVRENAGGFQEMVMKLGSFVVEKGGALGEHWIDE
jgi:hypothetical protein